jgi:hypothetical protein
VAFRYHAAITAVHGSVSVQIPERHRRGMAVGWCAGLAGGDRVHGLGVGHGGLGHGLGCWLRGPGCGDQAARDVAGRTSAARSRQPERRGRGGKGCGRRACDESDLASRTGQVRPGRAGPWRFGRGSQTEAARPKQPDRGGQIPAASAGGGGRGGQYSRRPSLRIRSRRSGHGGLRLWRSVEAWQPRAWRSALRVGSRWSGYGHGGLRLWRSRPGRPLPGRRWLGEPRCRRWPWRRW